MEFFCTGDWSIIPITYLFNHYLYQYGLMDIYCILCIVIQYQQFILLLKLFYLWRLGVFSVGCWIPFTYTLIFYCSFVGGFSICLALDIYILCSSPTSVISPKIPCSLYWRMVLETKIWTLGMLVATGMLLFLGLLSRELGSICVYTNPCIHIYLYQHTHINLYQY